MSQILLNIMPAMWLEIDFTVFTDFENYLNEQFNVFREEHFEEYQDTFSGALEDLKNVSSERVEDLKNNIEALEGLGRAYEISVDDEVSALERQVERLSRREEDRLEDDYYWGYHRDWHEGMGEYRVRQGGRFRWG